MIDVIACKLSQHMRNWNLVVKILEEELNYKESLIKALEDALIREHVTTDHYKHLSKDFEKYWKSAAKRVNELYDDLDEKGGLKNG